METTIQTLGWIGTFFVILAFFLVSNKKVESDSKAYQSMNLLGAVGVGVNVFHQGAWPAFTLQVIWGIISISILIKVLTKKINHGR